MTSVLVALLAAITYLLFAASVRRVFVRVRVGPTLLLLAAAAACSGIAEVWAILATRPLPIAAAVAGTVLYLGALRLFLWAEISNSDRKLSFAFSPDLPEHLVTHGPYAWIRHPFYAAYLTSYLAGLVVSRDHRVAWVVLVMTILYAMAARQEEVKFRRSQLSTAYAAYSESTGRFLPRLSGRSDSVRHR
jgi:protein-S-isoprenylcysteine O-methyltransferase Ste14